MAILKLKPACKDYLWGGRRLIEEFGVACDKKLLAEAWMLSCHPDGESSLENGQTLTDYIAYHGEKILGTNCKRFRDFPILIKFIDARENLSVQVHPPDDYALIHENQLGKNEMWYVLDADENSLLWCGFKEKISREEFLSRVKNNSLVEILNAVPARRGDMIFIPAGTIHAVGKGVLLAEIQQNSNVSYRIFDYGRNRPLHLEKALDVLDFNATILRGETSCDYFSVEKLTVEENFCGFVDEKSFLSVLIVEGGGKIFCGDDEVFFRKGDSFFLTAGAGTWKICGNCDALLTSIPS